MANKGAKKRKEENEKHMAFLRNVILISNTIYVLLRFGLRYRSLGWFHGVMFLVTSAIYKLVYDQLAGMAKPVIDDATGEIVDGGFDMNTGGLCAYMHDLLYITSFLQVTSILSDKFWWLYLVIPGFGIYKAWPFVYENFLKPAPPEGPMDERERKRLEKAERKANRPKFGKMRR
jgi:hypothetical protein